MTLSGSKSSCGMKVILSSRSMVDRRHQIGEENDQQKKNAEAEGC